MRAFHSLIAATSAAGILLAVPAFAAVLSPGDLIKGPLDAVYYYSMTGKRYVFPNEKTYRTWYADFSSVKTITAAELAAIPLGENVTYRPGVKMVKITTDPKVYAVAKDGTLRWIKTESLAAALYGADWNKKIDDVSDAYFTNYTLGAAIENSGDYSPSAETAAATDIDTDKTAVTPTPPPPTATSTTSTFDFSVSKTTVQPGDIETLTAAVTDGSAVAKIELFFDGTLVKTCNAVSCSGDAQVPISGTKSVYIAEGRVTKVNADVLVRTIDVPVRQSSAELVKIRVGQTQIMPNQAASIAVEADQGIAVNRIDIYLDGTNVKACTGVGRVCQWSDYIQGATSSSHPAYGLVTDTLGRKYTSKTVNIVLSTFDVPGVTVTPAKSAIYVGETVDITVSATDNDGIAWIEVLKDGAVLKHCDSAMPCTATTGPWNATGTVSFTGRAQDTKGTMGTADAESVTVANP